MTSSKPTNVLFLCTHNSARSILAEGCLNAIGQGAVKGFSAGSSPREHQQPNPFALAALVSAGMSVDGLHSKSWDAFAKPDAPQIDWVITVCDNAANEVCPVWPGHPASVHWAYPDPSNTQGSEAQKAAAFDQTLTAIRRRLDLLLIELAADGTQAQIKTRLQALVNQ